MKIMQYVLGIKSIDYINTPGNWTIIVKIKTSIVFLFIHIVESGVQMRIA